MSEPLTPSMSSALMSNFAKSFLLFLSLIISAPMYAAEVACDLRDGRGSPVIFFGKVSGDYNLDNFHDMGLMSIKVEIEGNGNRYTHQPSVQLTKKDTYIEPMLGGSYSILSATWDEFKQQFGAFPNLKCTLIE